MTEQIDSEVRTCLATPTGVLHIEFGRTIRNIGAMLHGEYESDDIRQALARNGSVVVGRRKRTNEMLHALPFALDPYACGSCGVTTASTPHLNDCIVLVNGWAHPDSVPEPNRG